MPSNKQIYKIRISDSFGATIVSQKSAAVTGQRWFVLYTKPRQEWVANDNLERQAFEVYFPLLEVTKRRMTSLVSFIEPFFPRYIFIRFDLHRDDWAPIRSTLGVCGLVKFDGVPKAVPSDLISSLKDNENPDKLQNLIKETWKQGDIVEIEQGPFAGYRCIFQAEKSSERVFVLLNIVGKQTRATLFKQDLQIPQFA